MTVMMLDELRNRSFVHGENSLGGKSKAYSTYLGTFSILKLAPCISVFALCLHGFFSYHGDTESTEMHGERLNSYGNESWLRTAAQSSQLTARSLWLTACSLQPHFSTSASFCSSSGPRRPCPIIFPSGSTSTLNGILLKLNVVTARLFHSCRSLSCVQASLSC
jgi:hypothetical protein